MSVIGPTTFASPPSDLPLGRVLDRLDALGQRYRLLLMLRGAAMFLALGMVALVAGGLAAGWSGPGRMAAVVGIIAMGWLVSSAVFWVLRPMMVRPRAMEVARLIEQRVDGLNNGLTNCLLLSESDWLRGSAFLPGIFEEIDRTQQSIQLSDALRPTLFRPLFTRLAVITAIAAMTALLARPILARGFRQMLNPLSFIPVVGTAQLIDVRPGDATLVAGQALDISVTATNAPADPARVFFEVDPNSHSMPTLATSSGDSSPTRFAFHMESLDRSLRYRVEVGGTQSRWYSVNVVREIKLEQLAISVLPPHYALARFPASTIVLTPATMGKAAVAVPTGSRVDITSIVDVPVSGAMLQLGDQQPIAMTGPSMGRTFSAAGSIAQDVPLSVLMTDRSGQIIARVPEPPLMIHATPDAPPVLTMKWPAQNVTVAPNAPLRVTAESKDDYGLTAARVLMSTSEEGELTVVEEQAIAGDIAEKMIAFDLPLTAQQRADGRVVRVRVEAADNRDLGPDTGPQTTNGPVIEIRFRDPARAAEEKKAASDLLRKLLTDMLEKQRMLHDQTARLKPDQRDSAAFDRIHVGQVAMQNTMEQTATTFPFEDSDRIARRSLQMLAAYPAKEAVEQSEDLKRQMSASERLKATAALQLPQRVIISTLESLLALLKTSAEPSTQPTTRGGELLSQSDAFKKLDEALKALMKEQQRILNQTASLAKKPVDRFDENDKAQLAELAMAQEKLDSFMQQKLSDFSKLAGQDMSNPSLLKDLTQEYSEVTMAKDALQKQAIEMAIPAEENSLELAKEITSNLERWLSNTPDRTQWNMEDPLTKNDIPMPELPTQLEDMIGDLLEQQEDVFDQMEDANANWHDSADKGIGWDAADGPIADMSAKGVTGNQLPNNNEMDGRSGEGRSGKSSGEFVGDTAVGKGGRNTPTRLDPTPFQKGQISDTSKDPTGGATGGGKLSGQGGEGLEGPVPPAIKQTMQRLAQKQAEIRNAAERLNLKFQLTRYDNFRLGAAGVMMRQVQADLDAGRYQNAMRRRDLVVETIDTSRMLDGGEMHVQQDTTPAANSKARADIADAMKGQLPAAWSEALKEYFEKLGER